MGFSEKAMYSSQELEAQDTVHQETIHNGISMAEKVQDGDEALKILHAEFEPYTKEEEKRVLRKIDIRMIIIMLIINGLQFVDKNTISAAATYGIIKQDHLEGQQFSLLISIFYIGYLIAQYPTNVLMQRFPIGKYLTINFILWGATLAATGSATRFSTLAVGRFFLGIFESCLNPGFVLITSSWWKREEQTARIGLWYCANGLIGAPSGLIFWAIAHMHVGNMFPYQWMFIFFGIFTVIFGISLYWLLPDSPVTATFLTERERIIAIERLKSNKTGVKNTHHKAEQVKETFRDPKIWMLAFAIFTHNMTNSLQTNFTGVLLKGFGYTTYQAVLLTIPPGIVQAATMLLFSIVLATKWGQGKRIFAIILCYIPGVVSCVLLYQIPVKPSTKSVHLFAVTIVPMVATSAGIMYSLLASNVAGYTKKTVSGAIFFSASSIANIISPQTFLQKQMPRYETGVAVTLTAFCVNICLFSALYLVYRRANAKRDQDPDGMVSVDDTKDLLDAFSDRTDLENKKLRYKL